MDKTEQKQITVQNISFDKVLKIYSKIINIEEYYHPVNKWTHLLPDGTNLVSEVIYQPSVINTVSPRYILQMLVLRCIEAGATKIQFRCTDEKKQYCFPDFNINELIQPTP